MRKLSFPFKREASPLFGVIFRPVAEVLLWSFKRNQWENIIAIIDSGADYSLVPHYLAGHLGIDLKKDCELHPTSGIGGTEKIFLFRRMPVKIGRWQRKIPLGFLGHDDVPPLLGRQGCLEKMGVVLHQHKTTLFY